MPELGWPRPFHPAEVLTEHAGYEVDLSRDPARPAVAAVRVVADTSVVVAGYQLQPGTWDALAVWCGGVRILDYRGNQALAVNGSLDEDEVAHLGDFVMDVGDGRYEVSRADGHYQRYQPVESTDDP